MRIAVTGGAILERNIAKSCVRFGGINPRVTFFAGDLLMGAPQNEPRSIVVELRRIFPSQRFVTGAAVGGQLATMLVGMAIDADGRKAQEGAAQILRGEALNIRGRDQTWLMASSASECRVFSFEREAGTPVVKSCHRSLPTNKGGIFAPVFGMTVHTGLSCPVVARHGGVQPSICVEPRTYFLVTSQTLVFRRPFSQIVTGHALCCAIQRSVSL